MKAGLSLQHPRHVACCSNNQKVSQLLCCVGQAKQAVSPAKRPIPLRILQGVADLVRREHDSGQRSAVKFLGLETNRPATGIVVIARLRNVDMDLF